MMQNDKEKDRRFRFRKARPDDLAAIAAIYDRIHDREEAGRLFTGWKREIYPTIETAKAGLDRGDLYVIEDEEGLIASGVINQIQVDVYRKASWRLQADDEDVLVLHVLAVDPLRAGHGYGKAFVASYEAMARDRGKKALRIDTNVTNRRARALYKSLGFEEVGVFPTTFNGLPDIKLVCLEKVLAS